MRPLPGFSWDPIRERYFKEVQGSYSSIRKKTVNVEQVFREWLCNSERQPANQVSPFLSVEVAHPSFKEHHFSSTDFRDDGGNGGGVNLFLEGNTLVIRRFILDSFRRVAYSSRIMEYPFKADETPSRIINSFHPTDDVLFVTILFHSDKQESLCIDLHKSNIIVLADILDSIEPYREEGGNIIAYNNGKLYLNEDHKNIGYSFRDLSILKGDNKLVCAHRRSLVNVVDLESGTFITSSIAPLIDRSLPRRVITPFPTNIVYIETTNNDLISYDLRDPSIPSKLVMAPSDLAGRELKYSFINYSFYGALLGSPSMASWDIRKMSSAKDFFTLDHPIKDVIALKGGQEDLLIVK